METRFIIAFVLCALMALILIAFTVRYYSNKRQFKIRQSGRGKNVSSVPAE
jgi:uncharacterized membrane protein YidH (DUF202 family)